jgi:hypothetical protein
LQRNCNHDNRETFRVVDEHDVRDSLHVLLVLEHDDVKPIEWTPSYATSPRKDFLLRLEQIVIVAKKTGINLGAKEWGEQLLIDSEKYRRHLGCQTLVCFVYDPEGRIANARKVENDLSGERDGLTVRVIIAPKELQVPNLVHLCPVATNTNRSN